MTPRPDLSARQRSPVPIDKRHLRLGKSAGGYDPTNPLTLAPGLETELARYPGTTNDQEIVRDRKPFYSATPYTPAGISWVNWTEAGPPRAELHMDTQQWRPEMGASRSRYPVMPGSPTGGMHTMIPSGPASNQQTAPRFVDSGNPQMRSARTDRLSPARYAGQSYSQTTAVQGTGRYR